MVEGKERIASLVRSSAGLLPTMLRQNTQLQDRLIDFFLGTPRVLVVGGEPSSGKSLLISELVTLHGQIMGDAPLLVIPWDRVHKVFFECAANFVGHDVDPPRGETHPLVREAISEVMFDLTLFAARHFPREARIIVEAPLIGQRGECLVYDLPRMGVPLQVLFMHSPQIWRRTLAEGKRHDVTEGAPEAMRMIRQARLREMGDFAEDLPEEECDRLLAYLSEQWLRGRDGMVVSWGLETDDDEYRFLASKQRQRSPRYRSDKICPQLGNFLRHLTDTLFQIRPDAQLLISRMLESPQTELYPVELRLLERLDPMPVQLRQG